MRINVKFFAILKDRAGVSSAAVEVPDKSNITTALESILNQFPSIRGDLKRVAYAVNRNYTAPDTVLREGDELALIPPVSGG